MILGKQKKNFRVGSYSNSRYRVSCVWETFFFITLLVYKEMKK